MPDRRRPRVGILISGRGSNMVALLQAMKDGRVPAEAAVVVSNVPGAQGLARAASMGVPTEVVDHTTIKPREAHEKAVVAALEERRVGLVCLAGYLRLVSPAFVAHFAGRLLNIHPSLLPAFPGLHPQRQALEHGARVSGATVHFVDDGVDTGPIVLQAAVPVLPDDTEATLADRILAEEHRLYPEAVRLFARGRLEIRGRRVQIRETP